MRNSFAEAHEGLHRSSGWLSPARGADGAAAGSRPRVRGRGGFEATWTCAYFVAFYAALLGRIGLEAQAVTSDLSVRFLRRPAPEDLVAEASLLRLGKRQAVGEVHVRAKGALVAHATGTYALPG